MRILRPLITLAIMVGLVYGIYQFVVLPLLHPTVTVIHLIDADTLLVKNGKKIEQVQLIGVDAPEEMGPYHIPQCFARDAKHLMASKYFSKDLKVQLIKDEKLNDKDEGGRYLRYVYLKNGDFLNEKMLENGLGKQYLTPNVKYRYQDRLAKAETQAQQKNLGIWDPQGCHGNF